jgi:hypothetical protein
MRKFATLLLAASSLCLGLTTLQPAQATVSTPQISQSAQMEDWKMGALPMQGTICAANGIGGDYPLKYVLEKWNNPSFSSLALTVRNTCTGYSITNRMTVESYVATGTTCVKFTNTGSEWDSAQGKYVWNQNIVVWVNHSDYCMPNDTAHAHRLALYVGYILGFSVVNSFDCYCVMGGTTWSINNIKYVRNADYNYSAQVYGGPA